MDPIPEPHKNPVGLHQRYVVARRFSDGRIEEQPEAEYFVLRLDGGGEDEKHVEACRKAALAYCEALEEQGYMLKLAAELRERVLKHKFTRDPKTNG